jgi:hypothetical protein
MVLNFKLKKTIKCKMEEVKSIPEKVVVFGDTKCYLSKLKYNDGANGLRLLDSKDNGPYLVASCNLSNLDEPLADDEIIIKSWSENQGMHHLLMQEEVIGPIIEYIPTGFVFATKHKLYI